jgi:hypothetical protein
MKSPTNKMRKPAGVPIGPAWGRPIRPAAPHSARWAIYDGTFFLGVIVAAEPWSVLRTQPIIVESDDGLVLGERTMQMLGVARVPDHIVLK